MNHTILSMTSSILLACHLMIGSTTANATEIKERLANGLEVSAEFSQGQRDKPAALILHGFLQTQNNATVSNLGNALATEGLSVLAPTLSLGISQRRQSLSCETPHPHHFDADVAEVEFWVNWLLQRGVKSIILIGHSTGNVQLLAYANQYPHQEIKKFIAISLIEFAREFGGKQNILQFRQAQKQVKQGDTRLNDYNLSYCNKYIAPADAYLSYASWDGNRILAGIRALKLPIVIIAGEADDRMRNGWINKLKALPVKISTVKGANHFFSDIHEFDLHDRVIKAIAE